MIFTTVVKNHEKMSQVLKCSDLVVFWQIDVDSDVFSYIIKFIML